jgi:hypothetical protein
LRHRNTQVFHHLEQVHVRGLIRRGSRLPLVAAFGIAMVLPALAWAAQGEESAPLPSRAEAVASEGAAHPTVPTQTTLTSDVRDLKSGTRATLSIAVNTDDGTTAAGAVDIRDNGRPVAGAVLDVEGRATVALDLPAGPHAITASFAGDSAHLASVSEPNRVHAMAVANPDFSIAVAPTAITLTAGTSGTLVASITPLNNSTLTAPMFLTLSCSGLPDQSSCQFTPQNLEILASTTSAITSSLVIETQQKQSFLAPVRSNSVAWAVLLPGALTLGGLAWSFRRRPWLQRLSLLGLVALVSLLGTTACNARYKYYNHGPQKNPPTPAGTYNIEVTAQSSDGVSATTHSTTLALTVK